MFVSSRGKREPFREAFARVKDMRSFLPGVPDLALNASVKVKDRSCLWKSCGMVNPVIVFFLLFIIYFIASKNKKGKENYTK